MNRLILALALLWSSPLLAASPLRGSAPQFSANSTAFFARLTTQPTNSNKVYYDRFVSMLVQTGVWAKLDALYISAAQDTATANTNLISSSWPLTAHGSPTFAAYAGYSGVSGASTYLDTGFDPTSGSPNYTQNSASLFVYRNSIVASDPGGYAGYGIYNHESIVKAQTTGSFLWYGINGLVYENVYNLNTTLGLISQSRIGSTSSQVYGTGTLAYNGAGTSYSLTAGHTIRFLNDSTYRNDGSTSQISIMGFGGGLSYWDDANLFAATQNYMLDLAGDTSIRLGRGINIWPKTNFGLPGGIAKLRDGRLIEFHGAGDLCQGTGHIQYYQLSSDDGLTWGSAIPIPNALQPQDIQHYWQMNPTVLPNGNFIIAVNYEGFTGCSSTNPNNGGQGIAGNNGIYTPGQVGTILVTVNSDGSFTWGTPVILNPTFIPGTGDGSSYTASHVTVLSNGSLLLPYFNYWQVIGAMISSDGGNTWPTQITLINANALGLSGTINAFSEANCVVLPSNNNVYCLLRNDGNGDHIGNVGYWLTIGSPDGVTSWTTPVYLTSGLVDITPGVPNISIDPSGRMFMVERGLGFNGMGYAYSLDEGDYTYTYCIYDNLFTKTFECLISQGDNNTVAEGDFQKFFFQP
jgi:hypothetical protein